MSYLMSVEQYGIGIAAFGGILIALASFNFEKSRKFFKWGTFIGALLIFLGFLLQVPSLLSGVIMGAIAVFLAFLIGFLRWLFTRRKQDSRQEGIPNQLIKSTQANQIPSTESAQGSFMKNIWKSWRFIAVILLIVLPTIVQLFIPPALWILILIAIGAIVIFIGSFITDTRELPDTKSKLAYLIVATVFFVALPISLYIFINPIINSDIQFSTDLGQGLLMASTVLLLLAVAGGGIVTPHQKPIEKKMADLIRLFQFVSLLFGFFAIVMILRWFILGGNELLANVILVFCYQTSSTLATSVAFITSSKKHQESK